MKYCPFNLKVTQINQYDYEYSEDGKMTTETHALQESQTPTECKGKQCACWRFGSCRRKS